MCRDGSRPGQQVHGDQAGLRGGVDLEAQERKGGQDRNHDGCALPGADRKDYVSDESVLGLRVGDRIRLSEARFEALAEAFLAEIESRFV